MKVISFVDDEGVDGSVSDVRVSAATGPVVDQIRSDLARARFRPRERTFVLSLRYLDRLPQEAQDVLASLARDENVVITIESGEQHPWPHGLPKDFHWMIAEKSSERFHQGVRLALGDYVVYGAEGLRQHCRERSWLNTITRLDMRDCAILEQLSLGKSQSVIAQGQKLSLVLLRQVCARLRDRLGLRTNVEAGAFYIRLRDAITQQRRSLMRAQSQVSN